MRSFIESTPGKGLEDVGDGEIRARVTRSYIEVEHKVDTDSFATLYYIPRSESSVFVAACLDHAFDGLLESLQGDEDATETLVETWPTLARLLVNGTNDRYSDGALIVLEDPDCGEKKWFVASVSGNIDLSDAETLFNERTWEVSLMVLSTAVELLNELHEKRPSLWGAIGKGIRRGLIGGLVGALFAPSGR